MTGMFISVASLASMVTLARRSATGMSFTVWNRPVGWSSSRMTVSDVSRRAFPPPVLSTLVPGALPGGTGWAHEGGGTDTRLSENRAAIRNVRFIVRTPFDSPQRLECRSQVRHQQLGLFPGREVATLVVPVVEHEMGIRLFGPAPRGLIELVRERAHRGRDRNALRREEGQLAFPVQADRKSVV